MTCVFIHEQLLKIFEGNTNTLLKNQKKPRGRGFRLTLEG